jgi:hypothetical protein
VGVADEDVLGPHSLQFFNNDQTTESVHAEAKLLHQQKRMKKLAKRGWIMFIADVK